MEIRSYTYVWDAKDMKVFKGNMKGQSKSY